MIHPMQKAWSLRDKSLRQDAQRLFTNALRSGTITTKQQQPSLPKHDDTTLATHIETATYRVHILEPVRGISTVSDVIEQETLRSYRNRVRLLARTLTKNAALRNNIVRGTLSVDHLVHMSPRHLNPKARWWSDQDQHARDQVQQKVQDEEAQAQKSKLLKKEDGVMAQCRKCRTTNVSFYQLQTRSGDEGMTTFYQCLEKTCGAEWRG